MKKILFILFLFAAFQSFGQNRFPSIDSAKNYTLRYYRNSTVETFTNLRGQNIAYGTLELIDSLAGNGAIDSIWFTGGTPDTLRYRKSGTTFTVGTISGGGGGGTGTVTSFAFTNSTGITGTVTNPTTTPTLSLVIDTGAISNFSTKVRSLFGATSPLVYSNGTYSIPVATSSVNGYLSSTDWTTFNNKQAALVSGTNIKTINGNSILGSGDLVVGGSTSLNNVGTGFDLAQQGTANVKRLAEGYGITIDSTSTTVTVSTDTSVIATKQDVAAGVLGLNRGTYAQRIALSGLTDGYEFFQTDRLAGKWFYTNGTWDFNGIARKYLINENFVARTSTNNGGVSFTAVLSGANALLYNEDISGRPGVVSLNTGTTSGGSTWLYTFQNKNGSVQNTYNYDSTIQYIEYAIMVDTLGNASNRYGLIIGPNNQQIFSGSSVTASFVYDYNTNSGNFVCYTGDATTTATQSTNTAVPLVAGQWFRMGILLDGFANTVQFYIDDVLVATHSATVPFGNTLNTRPASCSIYKIAGTVNRALYVDYIIQYQVR